MPDHNEQPKDHSIDPKTVNQDLRSDTAVEGRSITWSCHPVRRRPLAAVIVGCFILVCGLLVYESTDSQALTVFTLIVLSLSVAKFYLPTKYRLDTEGVTIKTTTQKITKEWSIYRSFYPDKNGVLLSPFLQPTRLENFRGLYIMFDRNRDEVLPFIKAHIVSSDQSDEVTS